MTRLLTIALLAVAATLAACAGGTEYDSSGKPPADEAAQSGSGHDHGEESAGSEEGDAEGEHAGHGGGEDSADAGAEHAGHSGSESGGGGDSGAMAGMKTLASSKQDDLAIELHAMPPEVFYVSEGDGQRAQRPTKADDTHLMLTVADRESGVRLPDATVTVRVTGPNGKTAFEGPLYPMVGRGMGLHYGENVDLPRRGTYNVAVTVGQPRVGRHRAVAKAWNGPTVVRQKMVFDGKQVRAR